jgi:gluconate 2-dehydrogenase gamma chain
MERRELFRILAATTVTSASAQHAHDATKSKPADYKPRFFSAAEYESLDYLCETIIPADEESGGARDAGVPLYIDTIAHYADSRTQESWRSGLASVDQFTRDRFQRRFAELSNGEREQIVAALIENERSPKTEAERLAVRLKAAVIEAWSVSDAGMKYFRYKGNGATLTFPGCTHSAHR